MNSSHTSRGDGGSSLGFLFGGDSAEGNGLNTSANRFACSSNQNGANVITDRPTTRVHHAPGGGSSIDLFGKSGDAAEPARVAPAAGAHPRSSAETEARAQGAAVGFGARSSHSSSNAYASGANQNAGNVITDRTTTRVHHAPGGQSSLNVFGGGEEPEPAPARRGGVSAASAPTGLSAGASSAETEARAQGAAVGFGARSSHSSSNAYASGANQNTGNVITDRPTTRVHHAPGGQSSLNIFSWGE